MADVVEEGTTLGAAGVETEGKVGEVVRDCSKEGDPPCVGD